MNKIKIQNTHIRLTDEPRGKHLTNRCLTTDVGKTGFLIKGWRDEISFDISYTPCDDISVEMYQASSGSLEIDLVLSKKPDTNTFVYNIQTSGLNFYFQPELTQAEIDAGCIRPENVTNSYSVSHSTKRGNYKLPRGAEKNYKTGNAFHIFRPQAFDADGEQVWCELHVDKQNGELTITVPQKFLNTATYPVRIDPEFGNTDTSGMSLAAIGADNCSCAKVFMDAVDGATLQSLSLYVKCDGISGDMQVWLAIYDDVGDEPTNLIEWCGPTTVPTTQDGWVTIDCAGSTVLNSGATYWIARQWDLYGQSVLWKSGGTDYHHYKTGGVTPGTFPVTWYPGDLDINYEVAAYGTYDLPTYSGSASVTSDALIYISGIDPHKFTYAAVVAAEDDIVTNYDALDIKLKHTCNHNLTNGQYTLGMCPRCLGTGYYYDIRFNEAGKPLEVSLVDKLTQTLEKFVLTENNDFHPEVAINVQQWLGESPISEIKAIIKFELSKSLMILMETQRGVLNLSSEAQIASIDSIEVFEDVNNPDRLDYAVIITTVAGNSRELTGTVVLNG